MLDIRLFRDQADYVRAQLARLGAEPDAVDRVRALDETVRALKTDAETKRAEMNAAAKAMAKAKPEERESRRSELRALGDRIAALDAQRAEVEGSLQQLLLEIPNIADESVPEGADDHANVVVRSEGEPREFNFVPKPHWEIGERLGILDIERGIKLSGSRFYVLRGAGAALQRALIAWMLDLHIRKHGYTEIYPPFVVKASCLLGTGQLPKFEDNLYHDLEEDLWLIPTAEVPVTNLHADEILPASELPIHYVAYTPCFRREKMSAGRDVRGIKRGHQFDKVEMVKLVMPESSDEELEKLVENACEVCRRLKIPFRVVQLCTADLGFSSAATYDIEMWAPGSGEWL